MKYFRHKNRGKHYLLCGMCFLTFFFLWEGSAFCQDTDSKHIYRIVFWNVENLFDTDDDPLKEDDAFTPGGDNHWTKKRYQQKQTNICRVLAATGERTVGKMEPPMIVGLAEVENNKVLRDLCKGSVLRKYGYRYVHFDSPDARGIDNALLYREEYFTPFFTKAIDVSDSSIGLVTRDLLLVEGVIKKSAETMTQNIEQEEDTLIVLVCHFPSKRGGAAADVRREQVARKLRETLDTLIVAHPEAAIVAMGDFNASPEEREIAVVGGGGFENLMKQMESGTGSHKYQGKWAYLDQVIVSKGMLDGRCQIQVAEGKARVFAFDFMLVDDERHLGKVPLRTYQGFKYLGGYSDHLPVGVDLLLR